MTRVKVPRSRLAAGVSLVLFLSVSLVAAPTATATTPQSSQSSPSVVVSVRIEGSTGTIFEGSVLTRGHIVTTPSGGSHICNGTNNGANPRPGPTATSALDDASILAGFTWDATYFPSFQDFFITQIADTAQTATEFWGILDNYQLIPVGGCQQEVHAHDQLLFAFNAFNAAHFLELSGPTHAKVGHPFTVKVIDGSTGAAIGGATVGGAVTAPNGTATITEPSVGRVRLKAEDVGSIRSNALNVVVSA